MSEQNGYQYAVETSAVPVTICDFNNDSDDDYNKKSMCSSYDLPQNKGIKRMKQNDFSGSLNNRDRIISQVISKRIYKEHNTDSKITLLNQLLEIYRPTYQGEGNRGSLKGRNGENLHLQIEVPYHHTFTTCVLISLVNQEKDIARDFRLFVDYSKGHRNIVETADCIVVFTEQPIVNLECIRIKRKSAQKQKNLEKICKLYFRLIVIDGSANLVEIAELYSDSFSVEQPSAPPQITELDQPVNNSLLIVSGKNFKEGSTKVYIGNEEAEVHNLMNEKLLVCFIPEKFLRKAHPNKVPIYVQVDDKKSDTRQINIAPFNMSKAHLNQIANVQSAGANTFPANFCPRLIQSNPDHVNPEYDGGLWETFGAVSSSTHYGHNNVMDWDF